MLSVTNPDSGSATEELEVEYGADPLDIGFNSRYLLDIAAQIEGEVAVLKLGRRLADADPGPRCRERPLRADAHARVGASRKHIHPHTFHLAALGLLRMRRMNL